MIQGQVRLVVSLWPANCDNPQLLVYPTLTKTAALNHANSCGDDMQAERVPRHLENEKAEAGLDEELALWLRHSKNLLAQACHH